MRRSGERFAPGEAVHLLTEIHAGERIHEIGTRAHVLADHGAVVVLHLVGAGAEVVTCPGDRVARTAERDVRAQAPREKAGWLRPSAA